MWLTSRQVAERLQVCTKTIYRLRKAGLIRCYQPDGLGHALFDSEDIDDYVRKGICKTLNEIINERNS